MRASRAARVTAHVVRLTPDASRWPPESHAPCREDCAPAWGTTRARVEIVSAVGTPRSRKHHVVVVGGGFGGLPAVSKLRRAPVEVTLVDRRNFHLFQPLTYQVATGALSPGEIAELTGAERDRAGRITV